tara:strand:+ start:15647 stop:15847 length:201 start_codon:yes stop_codon:yes gene_type:complete
MKHLVPKGIYNGKQKGNKLTMVFTYKNKPSPYEVNSKTMLTEGGRVKSSFYLVFVARCAIEYVANA